MAQELGPNQLKWLAALEGDYYAQTTGALHTENGFCCLGVACELFKTDGVEIGKCDDGVTYNDNWESAPPFVIAALGLRSELGDAADTDLPRLAALNDDHGKSFKEIAETIKKDPAVYFIAPV